MRHDDISPIPIDLLARKRGTLAPTDDGIGNKTIIRGAVIGDFPSDARLLARTSKDRVLDPTDGGGNVPFSAPSSSGQWPTPNIPYKPTYKSHPALGGACNFHDFTLEEKPIGKGSFGTVYRAKHRGTGKLFAIKEISKVALRTLPEELMKEERLQHNLQHEYIAPLYCAMVPSPTQVYFVMDFYPGGHLSGKRFTYEQSAKIMAQLLVGVHYIHSQGVGHFDLKPKNVMLDERGNVKIIDFGLAESDTRDGLFGLWGTLTYMAPEVCRFGPFGRAADYYSLAGIAHTIFSQKKLSSLRPGELATAFLKRRGSGGSSIPMTGNANVDELVKLLGEHDPGKRWKHAYINYEMLKKLPVFDGTILSSLGTKLADESTPKGTIGSIIILIVGVASIGLVFIAGFLFFKRRREQQRLLLPIYFN